MNGPILSKLSTLLILLVTYVISFAQAQNTIGVLDIDHERVADGYTLIYPNNQSTVYLIDNCGQLIHQWDDANEGRPGTAAYLRPDGLLVRCKTDASLSGTTFGAGGAGGVIELLDWDGDIVSQYLLANDSVRQHHQIDIMDNGNILLIAWERKGLEEIVSNGFDTITNRQREIWSDYILEIEPLTGNTIWEWHTWDHLIQDHDDTKANFGVIAEHPNRININYHDFSFDRDDWMHSNAISYNPIRDQIAISVRNFGEIWVIDHSTTIAEAQTAQGGNSGQGGDVLFRWGNDAAFGAGDVLNQKLFYQHDVSWLTKPEHQTSPYFGDLLCYNNFISLGISRGQVISPTWSNESQSYQKSNTGYLPEDFAKTISHPVVSKNYSTAASSIQLLPNGNYLMCAARQGRIFELTEEHMPVWEYLVPLKSGFAAPQGFELALSDNFTVRAQKYPIDYPAFADKDLAPKGYIETDPNEDFCDILDDTEELYTPDSSMILATNPCSDCKLLTNSTLRNQQILVYNSSAQLVYTSNIDGSQKEIHLPSRDWAAGVYFIKEHHSAQFIKMIVNH